MSGAREAPRLALVVPCYHEEDGLAATIAELGRRRAEWVARGVVRPDSFAVFVDDGSGDATWAIIAAHASERPWMRGVRLSRNFGHQAAVLAGLMKAAQDADCAVSIDADLQQDVGAVEAFVERYRAGADVVLGIRRDRSTDGLAKRWTAEGFYWLMRHAGVKIVRNHADYRLLSRKVIRALEQYPESNLFLRGLVHHLGFRTAEVTFDVRDRQLGTSKYGVRKMLSLALSGITSFSAAPLRMVAAVGTALTVASFGMAGYVLYQRLFSDAAVPGWASTVLPIYLIGGVQLLCLGVVGEYVGRIYLEAKRRPRFLVDDELP